MKRALFVLVLLAFFACNKAPPTADAAAAAAATTTGDPPATCTKLGSPCTVSPGKLGTCVEIEQTSGASAFVCQSQH